MVSWTSILALSLICHGGYSKPQNQNEGGAELPMGEPSDQNEEKPEYIPEDLEFFEPTDLYGGQSDNDAFHDPPDPDWYPETKHNRHIR